MTIAVAGRGSTPAATIAPSAAPRIAAVATARTPTIVGRGNAAAGPRRREESTDGLMGRLAYGLPTDTPLIPVVSVNRFTIDDVRPRFPVYDSTPPWVRRLTGLGNYRTDPYER